MLNTMYQLNLLKINFLALGISSILSWCHQSNVSLSDMEGDNFFERG